MSLSVVLSCRWNEAVHTRVRISLSLRLPRRQLALVRFVCTLDGILAIATETHGQLLLARGARHSVWHRGAWDEKNCSDCREHVGFQADFSLINYSRCPCDHMIAKWIIHFGKYNETYVYLLHSFLRSSVLLYHYALTLEDNFDTCQSILQTIRLIIVQINCN